MGSFFKHPPQKLIVGDEEPYEHWFGGQPRHRGIVPPGRDHPVHLIYDLDLRDPALGLASRFKRLSRLPLFNALQYNCCDMVYSVISDDEIQIVSLKPTNPTWYANHPFDDYPAFFARHSIILEPVKAEVLELIAHVVEEDGNSTFTSAESTPIRERLKELGHPFPQIGGRQFMWQGIPDWDCCTVGCPYDGRSSDHGKEVFAVIWERPVPNFHLWSNNPKWQDVGSLQLIFSRCTGCGVIHSCNRCD
jgi:hypothetical protein